MFRRAALRDFRRPIVEVARALQDLDLRVRIERVQTEVLAVLKPELEFAAGVALLGRVVDDREHRVGDAIAIGVEARGALLLDIGAVLPEHGQTAGELAAAVKARAGFQAHFILVHQFGQERLKGDLVLSTGRETARAKTVAEGAVKGEAVARSYCSVAS